MQQVETEQLQKPPQLKVCLHHNLELVVLAELLAQSNHSRGVKGHD